MSSGVRARFSFDWLTGTSVKPAEVIESSVSVVGSAFESFEPSWPNATILHVLWKKMVIISRNARRAIKRCLILVSLSREHNQIGERTRGGIEPNKQNQESVYLQRGMFKLNIYMSGKKTKKGGKEKTMGGRRKGSR